MLKRLKNIEDKTDNKLQVVRSQENMQNVEGAIDNQLQLTKGQKRVQKIDKGLKPDWVYKSADLDQLMNEIINNIKNFTIIDNKRIDLNKLEEFLEDVIDHKIKNKKDAKERYLKVLIFKQVPTGMKMRMQNLKELSN